MKVKYSFLLGAVLTLLTQSGCEHQTLPGNSPKAGRVPTREELNTMIDSLANKNEKPTGGGWGPVVYGHNYDFNENARVWDLASDISRFSAEDLWWCLMEHLDDQRYVTTYNVDNYHHIATIGHLCRNKAFVDLDASFSAVIPEQFWRQFRLRFDTLPDWYKSHQDVPLCKQQIERGEAILARLDEIKREANESWKPAEDDKPQIRRDVERQIKLL